MPIYLSTLCRLLCLSKNKQYEPSKSNLVSTTHMATGSQQTMSNCVHQQGNMSCTDSTTINLRTWQITNNLSRSTAVCLLGALWLGYCEMCSAPTDLSKTRCFRSPCSSQPMHNRSRANEFAIVWSVHTGTLLTLVRIMSRLNKIFSKQMYCTSNFVWTSLSQKPPAQLATTILCI